MIMSKLWTVMTLNLSVYVMIRYPNVFAQFLEEYMKTFVETRALTQKAWVRARVWHFRMKFYMCEFRCCSSLSKDRRGTWQNIDLIKIKERSKQILKSSGFTLFSTLFLIASEIGKAERKVQCLLEPLYMALRGGLKPYDHIQFFFL